MITKTAQTIEQAKARLASFSETELNGMTTVGLREMARNCGINAVEREGDSIPLKSARKGELLDALRLTTEKERNISTILEEIPELNISELATLTELDDGNGEISNQLKILIDATYIEFRKNVLEAATAADMTQLAMMFSTLGYQVVNTLDNTLAVTGKNQGLHLKTDSKIYNRGLLLRGILQRIAGESKIFQEAARSLYNDYFRPAVLRVSKAWKAEVKEHSTALVVSNQTHKKIVDPTELFQWAVSVLESLEEIETKHWWKVSIALSLLSGRRMAEIHLTASFEPTEVSSLGIPLENSLMFSGQTKAKGVAALYFAKNPAYEIPVLCERELILQGIQWLKDNGKHILTNGKTLESQLESVKYQYSEDAELRKQATDLVRKVNKTYNSELGGFVKTLVDKVQFFNPNLTPLEDIKIVQNFDTADREDSQVVFNYHKLRELYNVAAYRKFGQQSRMNEKQFAALILGHDRSGDSYEGTSGNTSERYFDEMTLHPEFSI